MIIKMMFLLFVSTRGYLLRLSNVNDAYGEVQIDECVDHHTRCNPYLETPCCEKNDVCKVVGWIVDKIIFACTTPIYLGENCENDIDCLTLNYAICGANKKCECMPNYININKRKCAPLITGLCLRDDDCAVNNSVCIDHECICKPSFLSHFKDHCKPTRLGEYCSIDHDCGDIIHMICSEEKMCACRPDHIVKNNATCASILGGFCENDDPCAMDGFICLKNKCQCKNGYISTSHGSCLPISIGKNCNNDHDCMDIMHLQCLANKCACRRHHIIINNTRCASLLSGFCQNDKECGVKNSVCIDNECKCRKKYVSVAVNKCIRTPLERRCRNDFDCDGVIDSRCSDDKRCVCPKNHIAVNSTMCEKFSETFCSKNKDCLANTVCVNHKCQSPLGKYCQESYDCEDILHMKCFENMCVCRRNNVLINSKCKPLLDGYCWTNEHCLPFNSACKKNKCICQEFYTEKSNDRCIPTQLGQTCEFDSDCELLKVKCSQNKTCD